MPTLLLIAALSYLLGSIPFGYLLVRIFRGQDVRSTGSGNIGATNVSRTSPALGALTLILDTAKGSAAVALSDLVADRMAAPAFAYERLAIAALFAVAGHMFPVWLKFRGGKGVATALGSFALLAPKSLLVSIAVFLAVVAIFRYVSLGSILAVALFPFLAWMLHEYGTTPLALVLMTATSLLIITRHRENIRRLLAGTENRFHLRRS